MTKKKLSIVIATMNSERYLEACLSSLSSVKKDMFEVVFVDGSSSDATMQIIQNYAGDKKIVLQTGNGLYQALNQGVARCAGEFVLFLHSDDILVLLTDALLLSLDSRRSDVYVGDVVFFKDEVSRIVSRRAPIFPKFALKWFPFVFHPNAIYPRRLLEKYPFNPDKFGRRSDMFQIYSFRKEVNFVRSSELVYKFRISEVSTTVKAVEESSESLIFWVFRVYVFFIFENCRIYRIRNFIAGKRLWKL